MADPSTMVAVVYQVMGGSFSLSSPQEVVMAAAIIRSKILNAFIFRK